MDRNKLTGRRKSPHNHTMKIYKVSRRVCITVKAKNEDEARELAADFDDHDWSNAGTGSVEVEEMQKGTLTDN